MNTDDERQSNPAETPPEGNPAIESGTDAGAGQISEGPEQPTTGSGAGPDQTAAPAPPGEAGADTQSDRPVWTPGQQQGWPPAQPGWPPTPQPTWPPAQPGWPPAPTGWERPGAWQQPQGPQGWPQQPQAGWPPTPQPSWPPAPTGWVPPNAWPQPQGPQGWRQQPQPGWPQTPPLASSQSNPPRRRTRLPQIIVVAAAALIAFSGGMVVDRVVAAPAPAPAQTSAGEPLQGFAVYQEALRDIRANYVGRSSLTDQQLLYGSIAGMVDSLGDTNHSRFLTPAEYAQMTSSLSGKVAGIGVLLTQVNGQPTVERVIPGSPAEKAGVLAGDTIVAVEGKSTVGATFDELSAQIRGDPGTSVTISVIHSGSTAPVDISIVRAEITAPLVDWGMLPGTTIADIALFEFSDGAGDQVHQAIQAAQKAGATAIVFDLRGNPGGLAGEARNIASEFLSSGVVYQEEDASGHRTSVTVDTSRKATSLPMVVLVDHDTASAAEIVAGALQDNNRAKVIGLTTIGTGTVLEPFVLSDGSVLLLGVSDWLTPDGHKIFNVGIVPDQTVSLPTGGQPIDPIKLDTMTASTLQSSADAQLLAAVKALGQ